MPPVAILPKEHEIGLDKTGKYTVIDDADGVLIMASAKKQLLLEGVGYDSFSAQGDSSADSKPDIKTQVSDLITRINQFEEQNVSLPDLTLKDSR